MSFRFGTIGALLDKVAVAFLLVRFPKANKNNLVFGLSVVAATSSL